MTDKKMWIGIGLIFALGTSWIVLIHIFADFGHATETRERTTMVCTGANGFMTCEPVTYPARVYMDRNGWDGGR